MIQQKQTYKINLFTKIVTISFLLALISLTLIGKLPLFIFITYAIMSIITYITYSIDKSRAINGEYRISEKTLHILSLIGGWIGAILAQQRLRHKNKKVSFQIVFWISVIVHISLLVWKIKAIV